MEKTQAILLRFMCSLSTLSGAITMMLIKTVKRQIATDIHMYGTAIVIGVFLHMLLVEIYPIALGFAPLPMENETENSTITNDVETNKDNENNSNERKRHRLFYLIREFLFFCLSCGITTFLVVFFPHDHEPQTE